MYPLLEETKVNDKPIINCTYINPIPDSMRVSEPVNTFNIKKRYIISI